MGDLFSFPVITLNIIDDYNREALNIAINYSFPAEQVVGVIEQIIELCGKPESIRRIALRIDLKIILMKRK